MTRKVLVSIFFAGLVISAIGFFMLSVSEKQNRREEIESITATLSTFTESLDISINQYLDPTLVLIINSECEHCQWQVEALYKQTQSLSNTNLIFTSIEPRDSLVDYLSRVGYEEGDVLAYEKAPELIEKSLGTSSTPQLLVYNTNQLIKHFRGETRVDLILEALTDETEH